MFLVFSNNNIIASWQIQWDGLFSQELKNETNLSLEITTKNNLLFYALLVLAGTFSAEASTLFSLLKNSKRNIFTFAHANSGYKANKNYDTSV